MHWWRSINHLRVRCHGKEEGEGKGHSANWRKATHKITSTQTDAISSVISKETISLLNTVNVSQNAKHRRECKSGKSRQKFEIGHNEKYIPKISSLLENLLRQRRVGCNKKAENQVLNSKRLNWLHHLPFAAGLNQALRRDQESPGYVELCSNHGEGQAELIGNMLSLVNLHDVFSHNPKWLWLSRKFPSPCGPYHVQMAPSRHWLVQMP